mgnify:CR=1 FL=1|tara:strand:+ start:46 stop:489 length:444 start_codon:yes stop_codon:yes gene_type:complete
MQRRKFIQSCCQTAVGLPLLATALQSCEATHFASTTISANKLTVLKSEFWRIKKNKKKTHRPFVLIEMESLGFPICLFKLDETQYIASLMSCTHKACELEIGGGIYSCPCHGSEFSMTGELLEGPAEENLKTFKTTTDEDHIYIHLS